MGKLLATRLPVSSTRGTSTPPSPNPFPHATSPRLPPPRRCHFLPRFLEHLIHETIDASCDFRRMPFPPLHHERLILRRRQHRLQLRPLVPIHLLRRRGLRRNVIKPAC